MVKRIATLVIAGSMGAVLGTLAGCSSGQIQTANRNFLATICANGQQLLTEIPTGVLTPAQIQNIHDVACSTAFGTTAAPAPAPGESPVFPGPKPTPVPLQVPSPKP